MPVFPIFLTERTEYSDECYGVIGRALAFVTSFEMNCKSLEAIMEMKKGLLCNKDEDSITDFCGKLERKVLGKCIGKIMEEFKKGEDAFEFMGSINKWLEEILDDARNARNDIAHDITKGIEHCAEHPERRAVLIKEVEALVRRVAEADVQVYNLCQFLTKEPTFTGNYCDDAVKWVCEVEYD
jgi:hypothetical protein